MPGTLLRSAIVQSLGVVATVALTILIANLGGPEAQGRFATYKSIHDLQILLLTLGLPSGIVYIVNKKLAGPNRLVPLMLRYSLAVTVPGVLITGGAVSLLLPELSTREVSWAVLLLTIAVSSGVAFALLRSVILTQNDGFGFASISTLPNLLLLPLMALAVGWHFSSMPMAYLVADLVAASIAYGYVRSLLRDTGKESPPHPAARRALREQSGHVFLQSLMLGAQPFVTIFILQRAGAGHEVVGYFNLASMVLTAPNLLVAMVAPILYNRWAKELEPEGLVPLMRRVLRFGVGLQVLSLAFVPALPLLVSSIAGSAFDPSAAPAGILTLGILPLLVTRWLGPAFQGLGRTRVLTLSCGARLGLVTLSGVVFIWVDSLLIWTAIAWVVAEYAAMLIVVGAATTRGRPRIRRGSATHAR